MSIVRFYWFSSCTCGLFWGSLFEQIFHFIEKSFFLFVLAIADAVVKFAQDLFLFMVQVPRDLDLHFDIVVAQAAAV